MNCGVEDSVIFRLAASIFRPAASRCSMCRHSKCFTRSYWELTYVLYYVLEIVFTRAALAFDNLFMGCVFNINTVHETVEKLTF